MKVSRAFLRRAGALFPGSTVGMSPVAVVAAGGFAAARRTHASSGGSDCCIFSSPLSVQRRFLGNKNPYTVLGIKEGATKQDIKKAYRLMARKHHPDAPGGNHEKFQEIQEAYEAVKSGVWIRKGGDGSGDSADGGGGGGGSGNRYSGFRYTTRTHHRSKVSYDEFYTEMHTGKTKKDPFGDDDDDFDPEAEAARKDPRRNPFAMNEIAFQAWLRFIIMWCTLFMSLRLALFLMFPPKWEKKDRKPPPPALKKKPPPPRPLAQSGESLVA